MGGRVLNMVVFVVVAALQLQSSMAQTTHVVGGAVGWQVPPGGATVYTTWASQQNFTVGDVLVFNFAMNQHSVAEVTQAAFNVCNASNPISLSTVAPTNLTLNTAGSHYFICTFGTHCVLGQRLTINVSAASTSPAPQPSTPPPVSTPSPTPSMVSPPPSSTPVPSPTPSSIATPPSSVATPPSSVATPPSSDATPPSTTQPPSSPGASPPPTTTNPTSPPPAGDTTSPPPPPPSSAPSFAMTALPVTLLFVALPFFI